MSRTIVALVVFVLLQASILLVAAPAAFGAQGTSESAPSARSYETTDSRALNATEYPGYTLTAPTIDGTMVAGEWDDAAVYNIGSGANPVYVHLMFDDTKFFIAVDAIRDTSNDPDGPAGNTVINPTSDYMVLSIDGDNNGNVTYVGVKDGFGQERFSEPPVTQSGNCRDRLATTAGSGYALAGFVQQQSDNVSMYIIYNGGGTVNAGTADPFDYIKTAFPVDHRQYEYSIPWNGSQDELALQKGDTFGISLIIHEKTGGNIGLMPSNTNTINGPYQHIVLTGKPKAVPKVTSSPLTAGPPPVYGTGSPLLFDGADSKDDTGITTYTWSFGDSTPTATGVNVTHTYSNPGSYIASLTVKDSDNIQDTKTLLLIVAVGPEKPNLTLPATTPTPGPIYAPEGTYVELSIDYNDANFGKNVGEALNITWTQDGEVKKTEKSKTAAGTSTFRFDAAYDGANSWKAGPYVINVTIEDIYDYAGVQGVHATSTDWSINVNETNRRPVVVRLAPDVEAMTILEGQQQIFQIQKSDPDKNSMTVAWFVKGIEQTTAKNKDSFQFPQTASYNSSGEYMISVKVNDTGTPPLSTELFWNLTITNVNQAPVIKSHTPMVATPAVAEGTSLTFMVVAEDIDKDKMTYTWYVQGNPLDDRDSQSFNFTPDYSASKDSPVEIMVEVTDGYDGTVSPSFTWTVTVTDIDRPTLVVVDSPQDSIFPISEDVSFDASNTKDPDPEDTIEFSWSFGDGVNKTGGESYSSLKHTYKAPGQYTATLTVVTTHDGKFIELEGWTQEITIQASEINIVSVDVGANQAVEGETVYVNVTLENKGELDAKQIKVTLIMDSSATSLVKYVDITSKAQQQVTFEWKGRKGAHTFKADIAGDKNTVIGDKTATSSDITVTEKKVTPTTTNSVAGGNGIWLIAASILIVVVVLGTIVYSMSKKKKQTELEARLRREEEARVKAEQERQRAEEEARRRAAEAEAAAAAAAAEAAARAAAIRQLQQQQQVRHAPATSPRPPSFKVSVAPPPPVMKPMPKTQAPTEAPAPAPAPVPATGPRPASFQTPKMGQDKIGGTPAELKCPNCGEDVEPTWSKCPSCSKDLKAPSTPTKGAPPPTTLSGAKKCPGCGGEVETGWMKCPECGKDLK